MMFNYSEYIKILEKYKNKFTFFEDALDKPSYVILRHDIEFSVLRAYELAKIEYNNNIKSTYFVQVRSNAYNPFSTINVNLLNNIIDMGHKVGLHLYCHHLNDGDWNSLKMELLIQMHILKVALNKCSDEFSYHKPPKWVLQNRENFIEGHLNAYGKSFFEFSDNPKNIKYIADSRHRWDYGYPLDNTKYNKIHITLHPDEWSLNCSNDIDNWDNLSKENKSQKPAYY